VDRIGITRWASGLKFKKKPHGKTQNKMVQPGTRQQEDMKRSVRMENIIEINRKGANISSLILIKVKRF
jgi:hypothetical protein